MTELHYAVPGRPRTWERKRLAGTRTFTSREQTAAMAAHQWAAVAALRGAPPWSTEGAFAVEVRGYWSSAVVGDVDRLASLALDALEGIAYRADRQVRSLVSEVVADGSPERVEVTVRRLARDPVQSAKTRKRKVA